MKTFRATLTGLLTLLTIALLSAQSSELNKCLQLSLKRLPDGKTWGVYLKTDNAVSPSTRTSVGTGQVTIVAPVNFYYTKLISRAGTWVENARVDSPAEAKNMSYISFGFLADEPRVMLFEGEETLLFTFVCPSDFNGKINLFDNQNDPFTAPNSYNTNPGNDIGIIDFGRSENLAYYGYSTNYNEDHNTTRASMVSRLED